MLQHHVPIARHAFLYVEMSLMAGRQIRCVFERVVGLKHAPLGCEPLGLSQLDSAEGLNRV